MPITKVFADLPDPYTSISPICVHYESQLAMFTIIQFLRVRANIHTVFEDQQRVYCIQGNSGLENSY